jgi:hypothetical protein
VATGVTQFLSCLPFTFLAMITSVFAHKRLLLAIFLGNEPLSESSSPSTIVSLPLKRFNHIRMEMISPNRGKSRKVAPKYREYSEQIQRLLRLRAKFKPNLSAWTGTDCDYESAEQLLIEVTKVLSNEGKSRSQTRGLAQEAELLRILKEELRQSQKMWNAWEHQGSTAIGEQSETRKTDRKKRSAPEALPSYAPKRAKSTLPGICSETRDPEGTTSSSISPAT